MYEMLRKLAVRPNPWSSMTIRELWTRPHVARQMLAYHLDQDTYLASRPTPVIDEVVDCLDRELELAGKSMCDLGCGPGLYSSRFAHRGASVVGVDFSPVAISYAESQVSATDAEISYLVADYLSDDLPAGFDIVTLIYYDFCALAPGDRDKLLRRIRSMLNPGGRLVMDVLTETAFQDVREQVAIDERQMDGFWSATDYVGIHRTWAYGEQALSLDHYLIMEPTSHWEIFNWMQYFSTDRLVEELHAAGFTVRNLMGSLTGEALANTSRELGVIAEPSV